MDRDTINLDEQTAKELIEAACDSSRVSGLTHNFYRYPARFSPVFAKEFIKHFTKPGDMVFDPFMGGGTTLVEASACGRMALGADISSLAEFIARVKTIPLTKNKREIVEKWLDSLIPQLNIHLPVERDLEWIEKGYLRNLNNKKVWRLRKLIEQALFKTNELPCPTTKEFARCLLLKTSQWALDGRKKVPLVAEFRSKLQENLYEMLNAATEYYDTIYQVYNGKKPQVHCINQSVIGIESNPYINNLPKPKLILTSPPYPGIHVLYHRWQVDGRKETPAPFWIASSLDGSGISHYTMGSRKQQGNTKYFKQITQAYQSISNLVDDQSLVVQMVAFSSPEWQLEEYLKSMQYAGFKEIQIPQLATNDDGRLWRKVPNRKWHATQQAKANGSKEVVLFHKLKQ